ncbi:hypothetical protein [Micromonospora sp. NPDC047730]|uniref:hypothetical protein n=1 Tax=Micromonospora sp. NPDC047730 TaxID=3364253 RepID=UPI00371E2F51
MTREAVREMLRNNPRRFGYALRRALWTHEAMALLPGPYGWNDGGCLLLAEGLVELLGREARVRAVVRGGTLYAQHFVVQEGRWHLDADGACLEGTLLRRWEEQELVPSPRTAPLRAVDISAGTPRSAEVSASVRDFLCARLPSA